MKRRSVVAFVLGALAINSCGFSPEGGKDARQEKLDDGFQIQIQEWLSNGKNLNEPQSEDSVYSEYPVISAAASCLEQSMGLLLARGADAKVISRSSGMSPLEAIGSICSDDRATRMAALLLDHGADPNYKEPNGNTALFEACDENRPMLVQILVEHGANVDAQNANGMTPLQVAAMYGRKAIAEVLINHGADVNARDPNGNTALAYCKMGTKAADANLPGHEFEGTMKVLQEHGAQ